MRKVHSLPFDFVSQCLEYRDGHLFWKRRPRDHFKDDGKWNNWNARCAGKEAGTIHYDKKNKEYRRIIKLDGILYPRSRLVWCLCRGEWPDRIVDHIDHDTLNDRIDNLRLANGVQSSANTRKQRNNTTGYKGVTLEKRTGRYQAKIMVSGKTICLGTFDDPKEAHQAYAKAAREHHGEFACEG